MLVRGFQRVKNVAINTLKKEYYLTNLEGVPCPSPKPFLGTKKRTLLRTVGPNLGLLMFN